MYNLCTKESEPILCVTVGGATLSCKAVFIADGTAVSFGAVSPASVEGQFQR